MFTGHDLAAQPRFACRILSHVCVVALLYCCAVVLFGCADVWDAQLHRDVMTHVNAKGYPTLVMFRGSVDEFDLYEGDRACC